MDKLELVFAQCHEVIVFYNCHKSNYETVDEYINDWDGDKARTIAMDVYAEMVQRNTVIAIQFYPANPTGFHLVFHYDLQKAAEQALTILAKDWPDDTPNRAVIAL